MKVRILLGTCLLIGGCSVFEAIFEGLGALVAENADRPRFAYALDDLANPQVRIATITEDDLGLPLTTVSYDFAEADISRFRFSENQAHLAVNLVEYFSGGQDSVVSIIKTETGTKLALQTDNTVSTYAKNNCSAPFDAHAQMLFDSFVAEFPFDEGSTAAPIWEVVDTDSNDLGASGWVSNTELAINYSFRARFGITFNETTISEVLIEEDVSGGAMLSENAAGSWILNSCNSAAPPLPAATRELKAGVPTGLTLDGASLQSVLNPDNPLVTEKVQIVSRWIY